MKPKTLEDEAKLLEKLYQLKGDVHMLPKSKRNAH